MGRAGAGEGDALHGNAGSHSLQPYDPGLLPETPCGRQGQESCTRRLHAQAADHTQQHGEVRSALGSSNDYTLTYKTVALAPSPTGLTYGLQVIEGLHRTGVEFRSLAEDFDTSTPTGKLQLSMVLAFSEWWRNSIRDRSVAGQAKARTEGRFPGRRHSLTEQQREYIRVERLKGVSQRELAKRLKVSRWTIQQVDG